MAPQNNITSHSAPILTLPDPNHPKEALPAGIKGVRWEKFKSISGEPVKQGPAKIMPLDFQSVIPAVLTLGSNVAIHAVLKNIEKRTLKKINEENKRADEIARLLSKRGDDMAPEEFVERFAELAKLRRENELRAADGAKQFIQNESEKYLTGAGLFFVGALLFPPLGFVGLVIVGVGAGVVGSKCVLQAEQDRRDAKGVEEHVSKQVQAGLEKETETKNVDQQPEPQPARQKERKRSAASSFSPDATPVLRGKPNESRAR